MKKSTLKNNNALKVPLKRRIRKSPVFGRMGLTKPQILALDTLWAKAVKARASGRCEMCVQTKERLEAHHVIGRRNMTLRHVVSNGCSLCHAHHRFAEANGIAFGEWIIKSRGQAWWDSLQVQARQVKVYREYAVVKAYLESFI